MTFDKKKGTFFSTQIFTVFLHIHIELLLDFDASYSEEISVVQNCVDLLKNF